MTQLLFVLPTVEPGDSVRVDTASGSNTPATVYAARGGAVVGPTFHADPAGALPHIYGADGVTTLYLKHLNYKGTVTGSPVTLTGVDDSVSAGGGSGSAAYGASIATPAGGGTAYTFDNSAISAGGNAAKFMAWAAQAVANTGDAGRPDVITAWGYNTNAGGGRLDTTKAAWHYGIEDYYAPTGVDAVAETYVQWVSAAGVKRRPWYCSVDQVDNTTEFDFYSTKVKWFDAAGAAGAGTLAMELDTNATIGSALLTVNAPTLLVGPSSGNGTGIGNGATTNHGELHVARSGGNSVISWDYQFTHQHYNGSWGVNATRPWLAKGFAATYNDFLYLGSTGNASNTGKPAMILGSNSATGGALFGKGSDDGQSLSTTWGGFVGTNGSFVVGSSALSTSATDGFLYAPSVAGTPTGTATAQGSTVPLVIDTTASKLWARIGGTWKSVALA